MDAIETCCKCLTPIGNDGVFLKNGTYMCPACYQRAYPVKKRQNLRHIHISVEGVIAIIVVSGVLVLGYKVFNFIANMRQEEALLAQQAQEAQQKRQHEEMLMSEERRKAAEAERKEQEARREAARLARAEQAKKLDEERAEQRRKLKAEEQQAAEMAEKKAREAAVLNTINSAQARSEEIAGFGKEVAEAKKALAAAESERNELRRKIAIYNTGLNRAKDVKDTLIAQYRNQFPQAPATIEDVPAWRRPPPAKNSTIGRIPVVQSRFDEYQVLVTKFDNAMGDVRSNTELLKGANESLKKAESAIAGARATIDKINRRLKALNATAAELEETGIVAAKTALSPKVIIKKDGTRIETGSIMLLETEVRYKDDEGQWKAIEKGEVEKIE